MQPAPTEDYYAILEVCQDADVACLKASYRRLALVKHPDKVLHNRSRATAEFQILLQAYTVLSDPEQREVYDRRYPSIRRKQQAKEPDRDIPRQRTNSVPSDECAETRRKIVSWETTLRELSAKKVSKDSVLFEEKRKLTRLKVDIQKLKEDIAAQMTREAQLDTWWNRLWSPRSEDDKNRQLKDQLDKVAAVRIKETIFQSQEVTISQLDGEIRKFDAEIRSAGEGLWLARRQLEQQEAEAERVERAAQDRHRKEEESRLKAWMEQVNVRKAEAARQRREWEEATEAARQRAEDARRQHRKATSQQDSSCHHQAFWKKVQGGHRCSRCFKSMNKFAFECPGCEKIACASCRDILRSIPGYR